MDSLSDAQYQRKYTSKYFPPDKIHYSILTHDSHAIIAGLLTLAEQEVDAWIREGVLSVRLWCDAYDSFVAEQDIVYRQYLILVRQVVGKEIRLQLHPETSIRGAYSAPNILEPIMSNISPNANEYERVSERAFTQPPKNATSTLATTKSDTTTLSSTMTPTANDTKKPSQPDQKPKEVSDFEKFCKKHGIRVGAENA
ncbi:hypothetical protein F5B19DRAFT_496208 [Rostrohypoxylon terebratum]|nr:hypothetical protein F5B19DRAFT_496208 [Rostrohypoxylon terebratum]